MATPKIKILAVDDSQSNLIALQAVFSGTHYKIIEATSGKEALELLNVHPDVAVILLDVQMPDMDGYETAIRIKRMEHFHDTPIIFITAVYNEDPYIRKGYEAGAIDYFSKPFDPEILKLKVGIYSASKQKAFLLKEREKRIAETEEILQTGKKLSSILENLPVGVLIADADGKICQINEEIARILCIEESILKDNYGEVIKWWDKTNLKSEGSPLVRALKGVASHSEVQKIFCMDGSEKLIYISASPLRGLDGHVVGAGIVIHDVTASKQVEKDMEGKIMNLLNISLELQEASHIR